MTEAERIAYVVQVLRHWDSLQVLGRPLDAEAAAPGCIGFMPVFKDAASAEKWRIEEHPEAKIAAVVKN